MKNTIKKFINNFGYNLIPVEQSPYYELINTERYKPLNINLSGKEFKIADSLSFYYSYQEIFVGEIYKFNSTNHSPLIIDCGSNCGLSILYFRTLFPKSKIIGIEADPYIFEILKTNINNYELSSVELYNCALWDKVTKLDFYSEKADAGRIAYQKEEKTDKLVKIDTRLLSEFIKDKHVDFLKLDIEGAETKVLIECKDYLKNVNNIFIEYHSFSDKEQDLDLILSILKDNHFRYQIQTQFGSRRPFIEKKLQEGTDLQLNIFGYKNQEQ